MIKTIFLDFKFSPETDTYSLKGQESLLFGNVIKLHIKG